MTNRLPAALLAIVAVAGLSAGTSARVQGGPTTPADVRRTLSAPADDSMEGRASGTPGAQRAAQYIGGEMRKIGLEPLGDSGYFQRVAVTWDTTLTPRMRRVPFTDSAGRQSFRVEPVDGPPVRRVGLRVRESFAVLDTVPRSRWRPAVNVVGVIRGSDPTLKGEYVLVDGHYDHLGIGRPGNGRSE